MFNWLYKDCEEGIQLAKEQLKTDSISVGSCASKRNESFLVKKLRLMKQALAPSSTLYFLSLLLQAWNDKLYSWTYFTNKITKYAKNFSDWLGTADEQKDHVPFKSDNVEMTGMGKWNIKSY